MSRGRISNPEAPGTADLLGFAALIDDGLVLCKDGSLLAGFLFRGPDQESATAEERNYLTARVNAALSRLGSGFAGRNVNLDEFRSGSHTMYLLYDAARDPPVAVAAYKV